MADDERREMARNNYAAQMGMLGYQPDGNPNDLVEVVRCKDCKYLNAPANGVPFCKRVKKFVDADWFCADGEKEVKWDG